MDLSAWIQYLHIHGVLIGGRGTYGVQVEIRAQLVALEALDGLCNAEHSQYIANPDASRGDGGKGSGTGCH
jgi:hypothetical protein